jgi:hypothetical protein
MLPAIFDRAVEDAVGLFVLALSFASDGEEEATLLAGFCDFHELRCYDYRRFQARQWGISVRDVETFVYLTTPQVIIFNTPGYLRSEHTVQEFELIRRSAALKRLVSVELGGRPLPSTSSPIEPAQGFSSESALNIIRRSASFC